MPTRQADPYGRGSYCIVVALHGTDSWQANALRAFRDDVLRRLPFGDRLVDSYYRASPRLTLWLSGQPRISAVAATGITVAAQAVSSGRLIFGGR